LTRRGGYESKIIEHAQFEDARVDGKKRKKKKPSLV
jgi:hypothetical protein